MLIWFNFHFIDRKRIKGESFLLHSQYTVYSCGSGRYFLFFTFYLSILVCSITLSCRFCFIWGMSKIAWSDVIDTLPKVRKGIIDLFVEVFTQRNYFNNLSIIFKSKAALWTFLFFSHSVSPSLTHLLLIAKAFNAEIPPTKRNSSVCARAFYTEDLGF